MQSLDEISVVVLKKMIFQYFQNNFTFSLLSPLEKGVALHLNKLESPSPKEALCKNLVEIGPVVLEKKIFKFHQCIFYFPLGKGQSPSFQQT